MPEGRRERIIAAMYACVARVGLGRTTVEDAARGAGMSRATVYREFPGGRDELVRETIAWEIERFFAGLREVAEEATDLAEVLVECLVHGHRAVEEHEVLQMLLRTEAEDLVPRLAAASGQLVSLMGGFLRPWLERSGVGPGDLDEATEYVARMMLSYVATAGRWRLDDRDEARELVRTQLLAGLREG